MVDRDSYHPVLLDVAGSPVLLGNILGDGAGLVDSCGFGVGDLHGDLDVVGLGDLGDHDVPCAGYLGAATSAVGDAAAAVGLTLARAARTAAVGGLAGRDGVEWNFDGVGLNVLSDLSIAGAGLSSPFSPGFIDGLLEGTSNFASLGDHSGGLLHNLLVGSSVLLFV